MNPPLDIQMSSNDRQPPPRISPPKIQHIAVHLSGTVQGVGFRPFIYNLARRCGLAGTVRNDSRGLLIHVCGDVERVRDLVFSLRHNAPTCARVETVEVSILPETNYPDFRILPSERQEMAFTQVSPDLALCTECRQELGDPRNRRHAYPFINCPSCGPRWTIVQALPYDRPTTTMSSFAMCPECRTEYQNPLDRRFHTQPVACSRCGPRLRYLESERKGWREIPAGEMVISRAAEALRAHKIVLIQGIGGFHLACDAGDEALVGELRRRKQRDDKPFALMFPSVQRLRRWCEVSPVEFDLLTSPRAPIVILKKRDDGPAVPSLAPENPFLGAMLPYSPLHLLLLQKCDLPLVMTSANPSDEPIAYRVDDALQRMSGVADVAVVHNRKIHIFADDSVVRVVSGVPRLWRRSRGYVPDPIKSPRRFTSETLAFGPQLKNTFCLGKENSAFLSQHIGDLDSERAVEAFHTTLDHFLHLFDAHIGLVACDLHPDYTTTRLAEEWSEARGFPLVRVQHHHAHLAACLADNGETEPAIGLCLDGTGYGDDGTIWGGEVLVGNAERIERAGHLQPVPMIGGESAVKEPWRMALAWLHRIYDDRILELDLKFLEQLRNSVGERALEALLNRGLIERVFPLTSSLGRLFDAVAAMLFFGLRRQYEGQAAMQLEWMMSPEPEPPYPFDVERTVRGLILSPAAMFPSLISDLQAGVSRGVISRRFHEGVVKGLARMCGMVKEETGLSTVAFSGGCFQNAFLHARLEERLALQGFRVLTHHQVPTNDGGVALGQAVIANAQDG